MGPLQTPKRKLSMQLLLNFVIYSPVLNYEHTTNKKTKIIIKYLVAETFLTNVIFIFTVTETATIFFTMLTNDHLVVYIQYPPRVLATIQLSNYYILLYKIIQR